MTVHAGLDVADAVDQTAHSLSEGLTLPIPPITAQQKRKRTMTIEDEQVEESTTSRHKKRREEATAVGDVFDDDNTSGNDLGENQVRFDSNRNFVGALQAPETARSNMPIAAEASLPVAADESTAASGAIASLERQISLISKLIVLLIKNMTWDDIRPSSLEDKYTTDEIIFCSGLTVKELREELKDLKDDLKRKEDDLRRKDELLLTEKKLQLQNSASSASAGTNYNYIAVVSVVIMMDL